MKKLIILFLTLTFSYVVSNSQLLISYKAKDGLSLVTTEATKVASDAKLMIVGTIAGQVDGVPVALSFDETKGVCTAWLYAFKSDSKDTTLYYMMAKTLLGSTAVAVPLNTSTLQLPFDPVTSLNGKSWIDSDAMIQAVHNSSTYKTFVAKHNDAALKMTGVAIQPLTGMTVWGVTIVSAAGNLNCMVNAETSETTCFDFASIDDIISEKLLVTPNPATETAVITVPASFNYNNATASIFDESGIIVKSFSTMNFNSTGQIAFQVNGLVPGVYHLILNNGTQTDGCSFVVVK